MKNIILHIGTGKTGTSTIQNSLYLNNDILMDKFGICYCPVGLTKYNHFGEIINAHYDFAQWVISENTEEMNNVVEFINKCEVDTILFSCETMYHHFKQQQINYLKELFDKYSVSIICYVRRQDLSWESGYKQQVKVGDFKMSFREFLKRQTEKRSLDELHGNYYRMLNMWSEVFSRESIVLRIFDKNCFYEQNLLNDFYTSLNVKKLDFIKEKDITNNIAFPSDLIEIIRLFNMNNICPREKHDDFVNYLKSFSLYENKPMLTYQDRVDILSKFEVVNKKLFQSYGVKETWEELKECVSNNFEKSKDIEKEKLLCSIIYNDWLNQNSSEIVLRNDKIKDFRLFFISALKAILKGNFRLLKSILWLNNLNIFFPTFYLEYNLDLVEANVCPFEHYIKFGWKEYRKPGPNLNQKSLVSIHNQFIIEKRMCL